MASASSSGQEADPTLKTLRESLDISQEELGRRLDRSFRTVSDWETGKKIPRFDNAIALAKELGVSLKTLAKAMRLDVEGVPPDEE
jgi:transcriptional regulator with XRE-family HTH domain